MSPDLICIAVALILLLLAAFNVPSSRVNLFALGTFFAFLAIFLNRLL
jgi:hypothetical protein